MSTKCPEYELHRNFHRKHGNLHAISGGDRKYFSRLIYEKKGNPLLA